MSENCSNEKSGILAFWEALLTSWFGFTFLAAYIVVSIISPQSSLWLGALALFAVVLAMNGLSRTDLLFTAQGPKMWRDHKAFRFFHHIGNEGELAGIFAATIIAISLLSRHQHVHWAFSEAFTLFGIMSAANLALKNMLPIMALFERIGGRWGVLVIGSLFSSLTGEPAAAVFLSNYLKERVSAKNMGKVATGLGVTIGSGGGLLPFAAPPVLIVYGVLSSAFGWGMGHLFAYVGLCCIIHVIVSAKMFMSLIEESATSKKIVFPKLIEWWPTAILIFAVAINIINAHSHIVWGLNGLIGIGASLVAFTKGQGFSKKWQPLVLSLLLMGLEIVGGQVDPLFKFLVSLIPSSVPPQVIAIILFELSARTSHIGDNALASRLYIPVAVAFIAVYGMAIATIFAVAVLLGALFGGLALVSANLPNFPIARHFNITPGGWMKAALRYQPTFIIHHLWIQMLFFLI